MREQLKRIAASQAPALIEGETGSGKELAARAIHYGGARRDGPFVAERERRADKPFAGATAPVGRDSWGPPARRQDSLAAQDQL